AQIGAGLERVAAERGEGVLLTVSDFSRSILLSSLGRYEEALAAAQSAVASDDLGVSSWVLPEVVEAAARSGQIDVATEAFERLTERTGAAGTTFARGVEAGSRALVSDDAVAEGAYREALEALGETSMGMYQGRAQLVYGEWLRRANRRADARVQLEEA